MSEAFVIAVMNMVTKVGFDATIAFLKNKGATIDSAVKALEEAKNLSLQQIIDENKASKV